MTRADVSRALLLASFALWVPAAALPARVWTASPGEKLALIAQRRRRWQAVNVSIAAAAVARPREPDLSRHDGGSGRGVRRRRRGSPRSARGPAASFSDGA